MHARMCACMYVCMYVCMHVCMYVCIDACIHMYICNFADTMKTGVYHICLPNCSVRQATRYTPNTQIWKGVFWWYYISSTYKIRTIYNEYTVCTMLTVLITHATYTIYAMRPTLQYIHNVCMRGWGVRASRGLKFSVLRYPFWDGAESASLVL